MSGIDREPNTVSGAKIKPFYERKSRIKLSSLFDLKLTEMEGVDDGPRTGARAVPKGKTALRRPHWRRKWEEKGKWKEGRRKNGPRKGGTRTMGRRPIKRQ